MAHRDQTQAPSPTPGWRLVDTHAHLDEITDLEAILGRARLGGVTRVIAVGSDYTSNHRVLELVAAFPGTVYTALGLHPGQIGGMGPTGVERTLEQIETCLARAVALGEVGLDYHKGVRATADKDRQRAVFRELLSLARHHGKPALIHSRYAWADALALVRGAGVEKAVFHWFTGPSSVLRGIIEAGYYISATPAVEYHQEHRRAVRQAPLERLLLETDSPVSYPLVDRPGRYQAQPADLVRVLQAVAELRGLTEEALAEATTTNALRLFSLPGASAPP